MRYLVNTETDKVTEVSETDDKKFYALLAERTDNGRQRYVQTGAHDPLVTQIEVPGQNPTKRVAADEGEAVGGSKIAPAQPEKSASK